MFSSRSLRAITLAISARNKTNTLAASLHMVIRLNYCFSYRTHAVIDSDDLGQLSREMCPICHF